MGFLEVLKIPETVRIPYFGGKWFKFMNYLANKIIRKEVLPEQPLNTEPRAEKVIATLTTYPARIGCVHLAIKSIMLHTAQNLFYGFILKDKTIVKRKIMCKL